MEAGFHVGFLLSRVVWWVGASLDIQSAPMYPLSSIWN
jgi:hypothetical protein